MRMAQPWQSHGRSVEHGSTLIGPLLIATREQRRFDQESQANGLVQLGKTKRERERERLLHTHLLRELQFSRAV